MEFLFRGENWRLANSDEIQAAQNESGAPHVSFGCTNCGKALWHAKNIALANSGGYDGSRNIFYSGDGAECNCSPSALRMILPQKN